MGTACEKAEDGYVLGIDGYVYIAQPLDWWNDLAAYRQEIGYQSWPTGFQLIGESLYYQYYIGEENLQRKTSAKSPLWTESESIPYHAADVDNPGPTYIVDESGKLEGSIPIEEYDMEGDSTRRLVGSLDGSVYYVVNEKFSNMRVYEVVKADRWEIAKVDTFTGISRYGGTLYPGRNGLLFSMEGYLYEYEKGASSLKSLLKWEDSNLFYSYVRGARYRKNSFW